MTKEEAIIAVLEKRADVLRRVLEINKDKPDYSKYYKYYEGKLDGFEQALDLLGETLESIMAEL